MSLLVSTPITDAVSQTSLQVVGLSPAVATSQMYQINSQATGLAALNAASGQQYAQITQQAAQLNGIMNAFQPRIPSTKSTSNSTLESLLCLYLIEKLTTKQRKK